MANTTGKGSFVKGDTRINRKGRPKSFDALRALFQQVSHEIDPDSEEKQTRVETIARKMAIDNPERFLEIAYGKVPQPVDVEHNGGITIRVQYANPDPDVT